MNSGRTIRLHLVEGSVSGLVTAEIMNWTGHVVLSPRSRLKALLTRVEAQRTGAYLLYGPDPNTGFETLYVGESDDVGQRISQHQAEDGKVFFERVCLLTSKDQNLTKAHVRYLESKLIGLAERAGRVTLNNKTRPEAVGLPEADVADMEFFLDQVRLVLPALGIDFFKTPISNASPGVHEAPQEPVFAIQSKKHGIRAEMQEIDGEFIVKAGSLAQGVWISSSEATFGSGYAALHEAMKAQGKLVPASDGLCAFAEDVAFKSPSAAAAVVFGRPSNGREAWRIEATKQTFGDWQSAQLTDS